MIRSLTFSPDTGFQADLAPESIRSATDDPLTLLWIDLAEEPAQNCERLLADDFGFHPLAIDDALIETHVPKIDDWGTYLYLVLHAVCLDSSDDDGIGTIELDIFIGSNYLVTHHNQPIPALDAIWELCQRDQRYLMRGAPYLLYHLADELIAQYMPVIEKIDDALDQIEDIVFGHPQPHLLERIFSQKRGLLQLRRILMPQREVFNKISRGDYAIIDLQHNMYFRDVYDHIVRMHDLTESLRDLMSSALDTYLSVVNNRMNEVMKILTVITTLFMPLSFLTGFFGMNFFQPVIPLAAWTGNLAFSLTLLALILLPASMFLWMRRRAWM